MALKIMPHDRLQEWVAEERGYFTAEGLERSFVISGDYGSCDYSPHSTSTSPQRPAGPAGSLRACSQRRRPPECFGCEFQHGAPSRHAKSMIHQNGPCRLTPATFH
jgi:hypothetical protein